MIWNQATIKTFLEYIAADTSYEAFRSKKFSVSTKMENRKVVFLMLKRMIDRQRADEKANAETTGNNNKGFNKADAPKLTAIYNQSLSYRTLSPRQSKFVAYRLMKYSGQLAEIAGFVQNNGYDLEKAA